MNAPRKQHDDRPADPATVVEDFFSAAKLALSAERWGEAASTLRAALELCNRTPGLESVTLDVLEKLAVALQRGASPAEALPIRRRLVALYEVAGTTDPRYPAALITLGFLYGDLGHDEEESKHIDRAVAVVEAGNDDDPAVVAVASMISDFLCGRGEFPEAAERLLRKAWKGLCQMVGRAHPEAAKVAVQIARFAMDREQNEEALALLEAAVPVLEGEQPKGMRLGEALAGLGALRMEAERHDEAEALFERAEAIYHRLLGPDSLATLRCLFLRGVACRSLGKMEQAEAIFLRSLKAAEAKFGEDHENVANIAVVYAEMLYAIDRAEEADALMARADAIRGSSES